MGPSEAVSLVDILRPECGKDVGVTLLCLAGFERPVWNKVENAGGAVACQYWAKVEPSQPNHDDEDVNYAVSRLLEADRPLAALHFADLVWRRVESRPIRAILSNLRSSQELRHGGTGLDAHDIRRALEVLGERNALTQSEMARLELLYLDLFWLDEDGIPNLEKEVEDKPERFCEAVALLYRPEGDDAEPAEPERTAALRAYRMLDKMARIPGHDDNGVLSVRRLAEWIRKVRDLCEANGRTRECDRHIGRLLSKAPTGEDGVWPCEPVREVLDAVMNDDIAGGFQIGTRNSRRAQIRSEGGGAGTRVGGAIRGMGQSVRLLVSEGGDRTSHTGVGLRERRHLVGPGGGDPAALGVLRLPTTGEDHRDESKRPSMKGEGRPQNLAPNTTRTSAPPVRTRTGSAPANA